MLSEPAAVSELCSGERERERERDKHRKSRYWEKLTVSVPTVPTEHHLDLWFTNVYS